MFCDTQYLLQINTLSNPMEIKEYSFRIVPASVTFTSSRKSGESIIQKMKGAVSLFFSFQQVMQAVQVRSSSRILAKSTNVAIDSGLTFQRRIAVCSDDELNDALMHELVHYHMSLFNDQEFT